MRRSSILNSKTKEFLGYVAVTIVLLAMVVAAFEIIFLRLGETWAYAKVIARQQETGECFLPKFFNVPSAYKLQGAQAAHAQILALGTSRIMPLGQKYFQGKFYNAGVDASSSGDLQGLRHILDGLRGEQLPVTVVLAIDPWIFNPNYSLNRHGWRNQLFRRLDSFTLGKNVHDVYRLTGQRLKSYDLLVKESSPWGYYFWSPESLPGIGLNAKLFATGFKKDGSFQYPKDYKGFAVKDLKKWQAWLNKDDYRFAAAKELDSAVLGQFEQFLLFCRVNNINVIGLLLPFRNDFFDALIQTEGQKDFLTSFRQKVPLLMKQHGFTCYDFTAPESLGLTTEDFLDMYHLKPEAFQKVMMKVTVERQEVLDQVFAMDQSGLR